MATKLGTTNEFFVASTKNFAAATKRAVDRTKHFVAVTKYFCYPYFNKWLCWCNKTFFFREFVENTAVICGLSKATMKVVTQYSLVLQIDP